VLVMEDVVLWKQDQPPPDAGWRREPLELD
jgi:hypothetical protein